jgi:hypothetical protein
MCPVHPAALPSETLMADCEVTRQRRCGPGGQHRNKVETAIRITHRPTGTTAEASERRSQSANLSMATWRLRLNLALNLRCEPADSPTKLWTSRCRGGTIAVSSAHDDFPAMLAEALDQLAGAGWNLQEASDRLGCSPSQMTKLLRKHPPALAVLNRQREQAGLSRLK